jgi:23S rRNA (guanosine2251-2'-O)-methyltransferase
MTHGRSRSRRPAAEPAAVVGRRPALEAVRAGAAVEVLVARGARPTAGLRELLSAARAAGVPVRSVPAAEVAVLSAGARDQGVAARIRAPVSLAESDLEGRAWPEDAIIVALDGVSDPRNLGSIARTAEAAGAAALVLRGPRGAPPTPVAMRASAGALLHVPVAVVANLPRALARLKDAGFWIAGLEAGADATIGAARPPPGRLALVLGSEGRGLSRLVRGACDELVSIPMRGRVASLNVSVAAGIALFGYAFGDGAGTTKEES